MNIVIVYGNGRKESTYNCVHIVKRTLKELWDFEFQEIWLPKDLPVHCCGCSNCMNIGEEYCPHRPNVEMFSKIGLVMSSAAGGGTRKTNKAMKLALDYMGLKRTYTFGTAVAASRWENVNERKKLRIEKKVIKKSKKYYEAILNRKKLRRRPFTNMFFLIMKKVISKYEDGNIDKEYWKKEGWIN